MSKKSKIIRGYTVFYDLDASKGIEHLAYVLSPAEQDSLFEAAWRSGEVKFEDRLGRNFILKPQSRWKFMLKKRKESWW